LKWRRTGAADFDTDGDAREEKIAGRQDAPAPATAVPLRIARKFRLPSSALMPTDNGKDE
jgi:hypothetical protein